VRPRVLLVDSDSLAVRATRRALRQAGYLVSSASSVAEAMSTLSFFGADVVVAGFVEDQLSGDDLFAILGEYYPFVGRVLYTAKALTPPSQLAQAIVAKADGPEVLLSAVQRLYARPH
jgi:DNA-binding NtrC family response regulator